LEKRERKDFGERESGEKRFGRRRVFLKPLSLHKVSAEKKRASLRAKTLIHALAKIFSENFKRNHEIF